MNTSMAIPSSRVFISPENLYALRRQSSGDVREQAVAIAPAGQIKLGDCFSVLRSANDRHVVEILDQAQMLRYCQGRCPQVTIGK